MKKLTEKQKLILALRASRAAAMSCGDGVAWDLIEKVLAELEGRPDGSADPHFTPAQDRFYFKILKLIVCQ